MNKYKVTIELYIEAEDECAAYEFACETIKAQRLSYELCTIEIDEG